MIAHRAEHLLDKVSASKMMENFMREHLYAVGQHVSYAEDGTAWPWMGGYEILGLLPVGVHEPKYQIRNTDQSYDRVVQEHELTADLGARGRGQ